MADTNQDVDKDLQIRQYRMVIKRLSQRHGRLVTHLRQIKEARTLKDLNDLIDETMSFIDGDKE